MMKIRIEGSISNGLVLPKEQWGTSNDPPAHFSAPSFKQACFMLPYDEKVQVILH